MHVTSILEGQIVLERKIKIKTNRTYSSGRSFVYLVPGHMVETGDSLLCKIGVISDMIQEV